MKFFKKVLPKRKGHIVIYIICLAILMTIGYLYSHQTWVDKVAQIEAEAVQSAQIAAAGIHNSCLKALKKNMDMDSIEYSQLKRNLADITSAKDNITFTYIFIQKADGQIYFLVDSEPVGSEDYSPLGQLYEEASAVDFIPFEQKKTILTDLTKDRWGEWRSVLVPILDSETDEVIAVFGIDYDAETFNDQARLSAIKSAFVALCIILIIISLLFTVFKNRELKDMSEKLSESESLFRSVFNQASVGIAIVDNKKFRKSFGELPSMNPMFVKTLGRSMEELVKTEWAAITHPDDLNVNLEKYLKFKSGETDGYEMDKRYMKPDGSYVWVHLIVSPLQLKNNPENNHLTIIEDISKRKELENILLENERSKAVLLDNLPGMTYRCNYDSDWTMEYVSSGCYELTGYSSDSLVGNKELSFNDLIIPGYQNYLWDKWTTVVAEHGKFTEEYEIITATDEIKWVFEQGQPIYDEKGNVLALEGIIIDITDRKKNELQLKYLSERDPLTDMLNLRSFENVIQKRDIASKCGIITIIIRKFNNVNSYLGYSSVQQMLKEIADTLNLFALGNSSLFHISNDVFVMFVPEYRIKHELVDICAKFIESLDNNIYQKTVNFGIGILEIGKDIYISPEEILKKVTIAIEQLNENERFGLCFYDDELEKNLQRENDIRQALTITAYDDYDKSLFLMYQPILDLKTDKIFGFEALARYKHEKLGLIPPMEFITIAEQSKLMMPIGQKILRKLFEFVKKVADSTQDPFVFTFNISVIQLLQDDFITELNMLIDEYKIDTKNLNMELTESMFLNNYQEITEKIEIINKTGIRVSIDDFGTGYSSLSRVRELKVNCLKIDKYFIDKLLETDEKNTITSDIISMAHNMKLFVVAEGVEEEKQKQYLIKNNCDLMQGYLFSRPVDEETAFKMTQDK